MSRFQQWFQGSPTLTASWARAWIGVFALSCGGSPTPAAAPTPPVPAAVASAESRSEDKTVGYGTVAPDERERPPASGPAPAWSFPKLQQTVAPNGLELQVVQRSTLPLVHLRLVVHSGQAADGAKPGLAVIAGEMLKVGGSGGKTSAELLGRVESLGASLGVTTGRDTTTFSLSVTSDRMEEALDLLGVFVSTPAFDAKEFKKLKSRETDRVSSLSRSSGAWVSAMVAYRELYPKGHPYRTYDATKAEIAKVGLWDVKRWYSKHVTPANSALIVVGDADLDRVQKATKEAFSRWRGRAPRKQTFPEVRDVSGLRLFLVHRPESPQAEVSVIGFGPPRKAADWVGVSVANQVLGGGVSGRLFLDVREQRSLAYSTYSSLAPVANGPTPWALKAGTQTAKAGLALKALLDHHKRLATTVPTASEVDVATRFLSDAFLVRMESLDAVAGRVQDMSVYGLAPGYYDDYRSKVRETNATAVSAVAGRYLQPDAAVVIVAGDAERLTVPMSHFGDVVVVDPGNGFKVLRTVEHNPDAPIELERVDGT